MSGQVAPSEPFDKPDPGFFFALSRLVGPDLEMADAMKRQMFALALGVWLGGVAQAAPLPWESPRAQDALKVLAASGVLQENWLSYRVATRWEIAVLMQRLLQRLESQPDLLASKLEREAVQTLVGEVQAELQALAPRVDGLEQQMLGLEQRVEFQERFRFRGRFLMAALYQGVNNTGNDRSGLGIGSLDYQGLAGSTLLTNGVPHAPEGIIPQLDLARGRPLIQGSSFTSTLYLDVEHQPHEDWLYQLRFYAYTSQGNSLLDATWGTPQPYLANPFTGAGGGTPQGSNRAPFSSMGFDRFRLTHVPTGFGLTLGSFQPRLISSQVFTGQVNPRVGDPRLLESFGVHASAEHGPFSWEAFGTYLPDGNPAQLGLQPLQHLAWGGALSYQNRGWQATLSLLQASASSRDGNPRAVGLSNLVNGSTGQVNVNWVNPNGFFAGQLPPAASAGRGSISDRRPVPGRAGLDGGGREASFGPQQQLGLGLNVNYRDPSGWAILGEWAHTRYRPSQNSSFQREGNLWSLGTQWELGESREFQLQLDYRSTDATYDPMILVFPSPNAALVPFRVYHRFPDHDQFWHLYSLHDTDRFPHNRRGFWPTFRWNYGQDSHLALRGRWLEQVSTSLQDVRFQPGQLGANVPNEQVLGHSPGFFDVVFREFSPLSFNDQLQPLENPRGRVTALGLDLHHHFEDTPWTLDFRLERHQFRRPSRLPASLGGSQNRVDLAHSLAHVGLEYKANSSWSYRLNYDLAEMKGHYDPLGVYNAFAISNDRVDFLNRDVLQHAPGVEATWHLDSQTRWDMGLTYYINIDRVPRSIFAGLPGGPQATAHPFSFNAVRLETRLEVDF